MKTIIFFLLLGINTTVIAQRENDQRTLSTKIIDVLAELPAEDSEQWRSSMNQIGTLGEEGLLKLTDMLVDPKQGNNTKWEYALGGFSNYVTQPGKEDWRRMSVTAYCRALESVNNEEGKAFLIRQLEIVGEDDAVSCLQGFLNDENLCASAAKALTNIRSDKASKALLSALADSNSSCRLSLVQALGDKKYKEAVAAIAPLVDSEDSKLKKLALYALANIADPTSEDILAKAAKKSDFTYENENATSAYLLYAQRLLEDGKDEKVEKIAKSLLKKNKDHQVHTRTAALKLMTYIQGEETMSLVIKAAGDKNPEYRAAALKFSANFITSATTDEWVKKANKSNPKVEAGIISMLGQTNAQSALPAIIKALYSRNNEVKLAAIRAIGRMDSDEALPELLQILRKANAKEVAAIKEALLIMAADGLTDQVANALPMVSADARGALLSVLGSRAATGNINKVFSYVKAEDKSVRMAALSALEKMATQENLARLFSLLEKISRPEEVRLVQNAIVTVVNNYIDEPQPGSVVLEQMESAAAEKKSRYFHILARIGGDEALEVVSASFDSGNETMKEAALQALVGWSDVSASDVLYRISQNDLNTDYKDVAVKGYIRAISQSEYPGEQKLLMLQRAIDVAGIQHKQLILTEVGDVNTFPALIFAGNHLDDPLLQQEAARSVMNIALENEFSGDVVRELLHKAAGVLEGPDSEYQKNAIRKFFGRNAGRRRFCPDI